MNANSCLIFIDGSSFLYRAFYAAKLGVYLHGLCGDLAKNDLTEYGVLASDQIRFIPYAIKTLL